MRSLKGRVVIITGASRGIGVEVARGLAVEGAHVVLAARSVKELESLATELRGRGARAIAVPCDVTSEAHRVFPVFRSNKLFRSIAERRSQTRK